MTGTANAWYHRAPLTPRRTIQGETPVKHLLLTLLLLCGATTLAMAEDAKKPVAGTLPAATSPQPTATTSATPAAGTSAPAAKPATDSKAAATAAAKPAPAEVDSLALLEKAVARDSSKIDNLYRLGIMYLDHDRPLEAITVLSKVALKRPKDLKVLVNLGAAQDAAGHGEFATELYRKALEVAPGDSVASCRLASSLYSRGKHQEAIDLLRGVIQRAPGSYCAYFTLGIAFADAGIYRDAIRMWKKVVELAPGSPEAVSAQESIEVLQKFVTP